MFPRHKGLAQNSPGSEPVRRWGPMQHVINCDYWRWCKLWSNIPLVFCLRFRIRVLNSWRYCPENMSGAASDKSRVRSEADSWGEFNVDGGNSMHLNTFTF